jgi:hypothetical protein
MEFLNPHMVSEMLCVTLLGLTRIIYRRFPYLCLMHDVMRASRFYSGIKLAV